MNLIEQIYGLVHHFPRSEQYGLTAQTTRAAVSVATNIAEGNSRASRREYTHFLSLAHGSLNETGPVSCSLFVLDISVSKKPKEPSHQRPKSDKWSHQCARG